MRTALLLIALVQVAWSAPGKRQATSTSSSATPVSTAVASASNPAAVQTLQPAPKRQPTCDSQLYCPGPLLQAVQLAGLYPDSKTFVDKPARFPTEQIVGAFNNLTASGSYTVGDLKTFVDENFLGEGLDIQPATLEDFNSNPSFLNNVTDPVIKGWLQIVHGYWSLLARQNVANVTCSECESSLIPLNNTFIVPGGRFREIYYWDSYWVLEGLLKGGVNNIARNVVVNFLDQIQLFGFIPNGGRAYYLNRSQPPVFALMLDLYVESTGDTSLLSRALPLLEIEMEWWENNRTSAVKSRSGKTHNLARYAVNNTAPRPEGYVEDYETAYGEPGETSPGFSNATIDTLFANLASGAESGQDYSAAKWSRNPSSATPLRTLNTNAIVPVDLNSILYKDYVIISKYYSRVGNQTKSQAWKKRADDQRAAIIDLCWNDDLATFYDFNTTSSSLVQRWTPTTYYAFWSGIFPDSMLRNQTKAQSAFASLGYIIANYNGTVPASLIPGTGQQWDSPNAWPPHTYIAIRALENLPNNITGSFTEFANSVLNYSSFISQQTGLSRSELPKQQILGVNGAEDVNITSVARFDELDHVGQIQTNISWSEGLAIAIANRYTASAYCSWYSTGGSVPGLVPQASQAELNATNSLDSQGHMFEKFSVVDIDAGGSGGEYEVVIGFGWTNGVAIWLGATYGDRLESIRCPAIVTADNMPTRRLARRRLQERWNPASLARK